ncbi:MAG: T9SS type A sorting domain-containing protein, partial [Bacteroidales bacterium]|nr:T9SS type A sorting domain-containing protein [Bacteroidales bacterium]
MKHLFLTVTLFSVTLLYAQAPEIEWQKSLGGSYFDEARSIQQTSDGGYIVAGNSYSNDGDVSGNHGEWDYWIVKLNDTGNIQWQKCLGGSEFDIAYAIQQTSDGGYIVAGMTESNDGDVSGNHGYDDYWVVKLDDTGNIQWQKSLGGSSIEKAQSIQQTLDGGYITAGYSYSNNGDASGNHGASDYWVVKLDDTGNIQWQKSLGGSESEWAYSIQQTTDGGYIVAGWSYSNNGDVSENHGDDDYWVLKLDNTGNIQWQKSLGGSSVEWAHSTQQTSDGGYIVAGWSKSNDGDASGNHGETDVWVVKLAGSGVTTYEITTSSEPAEGGTTTGGGIYNYGASVTVSAFANAGYSFINWTEDGTEVSNHTEYTFIVTEDRDLVANFEEIATYEITTSSEPAEGGTTTGGGIYIYGASVTVSAFANADYSFVNWTEDGTEVSNHTEYTFVVTENRDLIANFEEIATYEITTSSNPEEGGTTSGGGVFEYGTSVTVSAFANAGYSFVNWTEDGTEVSNDTEYTFVAIENRNIVANFDYEMTVADIENNSIKIYPNPITGLLTIKGISLKTELIITNTYGEIVFKTVAKNNELTIDVSELPAGIY